jgi:hypothetical protein
MEETISKFYKTVYNVDESVVKEKVLPILKGDWK